MALSRARAGRRTLRARLVLAAGGSIVAAVALFAVVTILLVGRELRSGLDSALSGRAQDVAQLAVSAPAVLDVPGALESPVSGRQIAVEVVDARGRMLARSLTLGARMLPQDRLARQAREEGRTGFETINLAGRQFRLYAAPVAQAGGPAAGGAVLVASDTTDIAGTLGRLGVLLALTGAVVGALAVLAAAMLTGRGLRPLRRLALAAGEIERTADPSRRLPRAPLEDEIGQLTGVLNRMLAALEAASVGERRFLADASHELRTPVTALLGNVEYVARHGADPEVVEDLRRDAARLARLVDDLLALERAGARGQQTATVELDAVVAEVLERFEASGRVGAGAVEPLSVAGDRDALVRALANLVENGLVHGPAEGRVTISLQAREQTAVLTVRDQGFGPATGDRERVFERFWRAPAASGRPGSGLGLSIVGAIAERHGGRVTVEGSAFSLELPLQRRQPQPSGNSHSVLSDS